LIKAIKKDEELVNELDNFAKDDNHVHLWWLGQSGFLIQWKQKRVLIDPYLSDTLTKKYAATDKPHTRMSELVINPGLLKNISVVTSSHNHTDHLDAETLIPVLQSNPGIAFIIPEANRDFVCERVKCERDFPMGLTDGKSITLNQLIFHGIPAKHNEIERDDNGNCKQMGYVIELGRTRIYHSGDTLWFDDMISLLKPFAVDVALLPINGDDPGRKVAGNLNCKEAARLGKAINAEVVIPCHYDMFTFNTADVNDFIKEAENIRQAYKVLNPGGHFQLETK
jgi:L-ascorbate metabolism protein UlaG (beta-lactamase superfamily)